MVDQKISSKAGEGTQNDVSQKHEDCLQPTLIELVRLLARSAAIDTFEASSNSNKGKTDVKD